MDLSGVISISGKPGLYKVVAQAKNNIIVESLIDGKRLPAYSTDRISALDDISIYTYEEDIPLKEVYESIYKKEEGGQTLSHKESLNKLTEYLLEVLPDYDEDRVYPSDIKKLFQWYNILHKAGILELEEEEEDAEAPESKQEAQKEELSEKTEKKQPAKKSGKKAATSKKDGQQSSTKKTTTKKTTTNKKTTSKKS